MDHILTHRYSRERLTAVNTVPRDLSSVYSDIILRIERGTRPDKELAMRILSWVFHARRPMQMGELLEALAVDGFMPGQHPELTLEDVLREKLPAAEIIECCKSLVMHEESSGLVIFTHFTVHQFIADHISKKLPPMTDLAYACLTYFTFPEFDELYQLSQFPPKSDEKYKFGMYAAEYWAVHTKGEAETLTSVQSAFFRVFGNENKTLSVMKRWMYADTFDGKLCPRQTPLHIMASFGLATMCELYLNGGLNEMYPYTWSTLR